MVERAVVADICDSERVEFSLAVVGAVEVTSKLKGIVVGFNLVERLLDDFIALIVEESALSPFRVVDCARLVVFTDFRVAGVDQSSNLSVLG